MWPPLSPPHWNFPPLQYAESADKSADTYGHYWTVLTVIIVTNISIKINKQQSNIYESANLSPVLEMTPWRHLWSRGCQMTNPRTCARHQSKIPSNVLKHQKINKLMGVSNTHQAIATNGNSGWHHPSHLSPYYPTGRGTQSGPGKKKRGKRFLTFYSLFLFIILQTSQSHTPIALAVHTA